MQVSIILHNTGYMNIIDIHTHVFPRHIAEKAVPALAKSAGISAYLDGTVSSLVASMDAAGIAQSAVMPIATKPRQVASINEWIAGLDPKRFIRFGTIHPESEDVHAHIDHVIELGLSGIKLHPDYQDFLPDDEDIFHVYDRIRRDNFVLLMHCGKDFSFEEIAATPARVRRVLDAFPGICMVAAHFGGYQVWDEVEDFLIGSNVYLDTSFTLPHLDASRFVAMARSHGIEKVVFGTDSPWTAQADEIEKIQHCGFEDDEQRNIFYRNARRILSLSR